jgi:hypothetical protein
VADYFLVHDDALFEASIRPALAASWRARSFEPCRALCASLLGAARAYARRYHTGEDEPLLAHVARGLPFDRHCWKALAGEILLYAAAEIPEFPSNTEDLVRILAPEHSRAGVANREAFAPIQQALLGSRDLTFGSAVYRPEHAGYNNCADIVRLAEYLQGVRPEEWTPADLEGLPDLGDEADRADELDFVREWFPELAGLYRRAAGRGQVVVIERIY